MTELHLNKVRKKQSAGHFLMLLDQINSTNVQGAPRAGILRETGHDDPAFNCNVIVIKYPIEKKDLGVCQKNVSIVKHENYSLLKTKLL